MVFPFYCYFPHSRQADDPAIIYDRPGNGDSEDDDPYEYVDVSLCSLSFLDVFSGYLGCSCTVELRDLTLN